MVKCGPLAAALTVSIVSAAGLVGTRTPVTDTAFCKTSYRCALKGAGQVGPFKRSILDIKERKPRPDQFQSEWQLTVYSRDSRAVSLMWEVHYQDDFYFPETERMLTSLARAFLGVPVPKEAISRMVRNAMLDQNDPTKARVESPQYVIDSVSRLEGNARALYLFFADKTQYTALRAVVPARSTLTDAERRIWIERLRKAINGFEGDPSGCPNYQPGFTLMYPGGGGVSFDSLSAMFTKLGLSNSGGAWTLPDFPSSPFFILDHGKDWCVAVD